MSLLLLVSAALAGGVQAREVTHQGARYAVVTIDLRQADLRLYGQGAGGFHRIDALETWLSGRGETLTVATNAGMFHTGAVPVGLHVEGGVEHSPITLADGKGNFFMKPNGVFWVDGSGAHVAKSEDWAGTTPKTKLATQSGPMLLIEGAVHPVFKPDSRSLRLRSGVGVGADPHVVHLAISYDRIRFYDFATLFRDVLKCRDALFLDGEISSMRAPEVEPVRSAIDYSGILAVVEQN